MLRVELEAEDLLLEGEDAAAAARDAELEGFSASTREVAPAVAETDEFREFLGGNVKHLISKAGGYTHGSFCICFFRL